MSADTEAKRTQIREPIAAMSLGSAVGELARITELALEEAPLSFTQYRILQRLQQGHSIASELALRLRLTKPSVTRLVDALVDLRYIVRRVDPADRRRVIHTITARGTRVLERTNAIVERHVMRVLKELDDTDVEAARRSIQLFGWASRASCEHLQSDGRVR